MKKILNFIHSAADSVSFGKLYVISFAKRIMKPIARPFMKPILKPILTSVVLFVGMSLVLPTSTASAQNFPMKPGESLNSVRETFRAWHTDHPKETATVTIAPGEYFLDAAVVFTAEDSNTRYVASDAAQKPVFTRGKEITGWKKDAEGRFVTQIADVRDGKLWFESLFVDGTRAIPARTPNADALEGRRYFYVLDADEMNPATKFIPREEQRALFEEIAASKNPQDVKIMFYHSWESSLHRVQNYDSAQNCVTLTGGPRWTLNQWGTNLRYHVEGVESALDEPGEFLLKRDGTCIYIPRDGETPENVRFFAPMGPKSFEESGFLKFQGAADAKVVNVSFENVIFACDVWNLPPNGLSDGQSAVGSPASILANYAENLLFSNCVVRNVGGYAFHFHQACKKCTINKCLLEDLGAGGVRIGPVKLEELPEAQQTSENTVSNCIIRGYGRIDAGGIGVWLGHTSKNNVTHNDISDGFYTGVSLGWVWGYGKSISSWNHIDFNHIHHIGQGVLSDMGGIYSLGISYGTTELNNVIHDVNSYNRYGRGGWGIYTDEGSSHITIANNLVYRTHTGSFHQHYGAKNHVFNNIFAFSREEQLQRSRPEDHISFYLERNIIVYDSSEGEALLRGEWQNVFSIVNHNLYWNYDAKEGVSFGGLTFEQWNEWGKDRDGIIADPCFVDAKHNDFRFTDASEPILKEIGFEPFDFTQAGVLKDDENWVDEAKNWNYPPVILAPDAPEPPLFEISDDFESKRLKPIRKVREPAGKTDAYKIQEENGNHFLRIFDTPDQKNSFDPFFSYDMKYVQNGTANIAFCARVSEEAEMMLEARDDASPYRTSVSLRLKAAEIDASKKILDAKPNRWYKFEIALPVGPDRGANYTLKVTPEVGETQSFTLPIVNPDWNSLNSFVIAALGNVNATLDLDDVQISFSPAKP